MSDLSAIILGAAVALALLLLGGGIGYLLARRGPFVHRSSVVIPYGSCERMAHDHSYAASALAKALEKVLGGKS